MGWLPRSGLVLQSEIIKMAELYLNMWYNYYGG
jgi:hypothetical protein